MQDPSNGGTAPQNYVNIASSCLDKTLPSIYYFLHQGATPDQDVIMFRWRVEQIANNYATGPSPGTFGATDPWSSGLWSVLFDVDGDGFIDLAAHLDGSSGAPATPIDLIAGIWSTRSNQSLDYVGDPTNVKLIAHNPTAFVDQVTNRIFNFQNSLTPVAVWPNGAAETTWDYGTTRARLVTTSPCNEYFVDYQIPVALLDASSLGGPQITRSSPIAMLFCTANSLNNPFQKDCALNRSYTGTAAKPGPFGDYISFDQTAPYAQPIISGVSAQAPSSCPGSYTLTAIVQDTLALTSGVVVPSVKAVSFWSYYDANGNGVADDGNAWTLAASGTLKTGTLNTWNASWDASSLPRGQYLIGVQAVDDNTKVDDGMTPSGIDNLTFSYVSGDGTNRITTGTTVQSGITIPVHSPAISPVADQDWWGNPTITGLQTALVGVALNVCGPAPTLDKVASVSNVAGGGTVDFTLTVANPMLGAITLSQIIDVLPTGFTFASDQGGTLSPTTSPSGGATGTIAWTFSPAVSIPAGSSATLTFRTTAPTTAGNYNNSGTATTSFGTLTSPPAAVAVDSARVSLSKTPSVYGIDPDGTTHLTYTLAYSNDSTVSVTAASIGDVLPSGVTFVGCSGGTTCENASGTVGWTLGTLTAGATGTVTLTVTVDPDYSTTSLVNSATLTGTDPGGNPITQTASTTIAVNVPHPNIVLQKTAGSTLIAPGATVTFTIAYANNGTAVANGVVITDVVPSGFTFQSATGSPSSTPAVGGTGTVTWNIGSVAAGASGTVTMTLQAGDPYSASNPQTNTASCTWTGNGTPVTASASVSVSQSGTLCVPYYFTNSQQDVGFASPPNRNVANTTTPSGANALITTLAPADTLTEIARFYQDPASSAFIDFSSGSTISGQLSYERSVNGANGTFQVQTFDYDPTTGATTLLGTATFADNGNDSPPITLSAGTLSGQLQLGHRLLWVVSFDNTSNKNPNVSLTVNSTQSTVSVCSPAPANLVLTKQVDQTSAAPGATLTYTMNFSNASGSSSATSAQIVDTLPTGVTFVSAALNGVAATPSGSNPYTFAVSSSAGAAGTIAPGASGTLVVTATIDTPLDASIAGVTNSASLSSTQTSAVTATATTGINGRGGSPGGAGTPALAITLSADRTAAVPGETVTYTITVVNIGTADASNVQVSDVLPLATYYTFGTCPAGTGGVTCTDASGTLTWNVGSLAMGASATYTFTMVAGSLGLPAGVTVIPDAASTQATAVAAVNSNVVNVTLNGNPDLTLGKLASPSSGLVPGDAITYTLTVTNTGTATATGVVVIDPIPSGTAFSGGIVASQGSGVFDAVANRVVFSVGQLASGVSATLSFQVSVASLPAGSTSIPNTASVSAENAFSRTASAPATAIGTAQLTLVKQAPAQVAYPAATLTQAANGTTLFVNDTAQIALGQYVAVGADVRQVTGITGNTLEVNASLTASAGSSVIGDITYGLSYQNIGTSTATNVTLTDTLPPGATFVAASNGGTGTAPVVWNLGDVGPGEGGSVQLVVIPGGVGTHVNNASITCGSCTPAPASATTTAGGLLVTKRTTTPTSAAGGTAVYIIDVQNTSASPIASVTVTDTLTSGFTYGSTTSILNDGVSTPATTSPAADDTVPTWGTFTIQPGTTLTLTFVANIATTVGAATYQNPAAAAPAGSTVAFDPLTTTVEDVTVLASGTGVVQGYAFRDNNNNGTFEPDIDTPLTGVGVNVTDGTLTLYTLSTDSSGYFSRVVAAGSAVVDLANADIPGGLVLGSGFSDPDTVNVPSGGVASKNTAYVPDGIMPDLTIAKSHTGNFTQGQSGALYTLTVTNAGAGPTTGTVTVTDTLPSGFTATAMAGTGWSCVLATRTCTRGDALAAGLSYPGITLTVNVASDAAPSLTNTATVSGGGEANTANNTASDVTTVTAFSGTPDLTITKWHVGSFVRGQTGATYTILVTNVGTSVTTGTVTVTDTLPAGLIATAMAGTGWSCDLGTHTCTRADALGAGSSYPAITVMVDVAAEAAAELTNAASVAGGGETNSTNNSASDQTIIITLGAPDLSIVKGHSGDFTQGQTGVTYSLTVTNTGSGVTTGMVTVVDTVPTGLTATALSGTGWACDVGTRTCTRSDPLGAGSSYPVITMTVDVALDAAGSLTNTAEVSGGGDTNAGNNSASDPTIIGLYTGLPDLTIAKSHAGNFRQGQPGASYTLMITNVGPAATTGTVTVTESLPASLTATAMAGPGWTCDLGLLTCTRADALGAGANYPSIIVTVNVAADAPTDVTNSAAVSGGGDANGTNNAAADPTIIDAVAPIPTLGEWAFGLLTAFLAWTALRAIRRRAGRSVMI